MKKVFLQLFNNPLITLLFRYGIVGVVATVVHFSITSIAYKHFLINYFSAHLIGFIFGLFTAYFGHYFYSFRDKGQHSKRFKKFVVIAIISLVIHQGGAYILVEGAQLDYSSQVLPMLVLFVPLFTFLLNKFWVFSAIEESK